MKTNMVKNNEGDFRFNVDIYVFREGENYISYCPSLDICSSGRDFNDAVKNFYEAFELYAAYWTEHGTLESDLRAHGWVVEERTARPPQAKQLLEQAMFGELMASDALFPDAGHREDYGTWAVDTARGGLAVALRQPRPRRLAAAEGGPVQRECEPGQEGADMSLLD